MAQFHTDEYVDFLSRVTPDLVEAAMEGGGGGRAGGIGREMGRCKSLHFELSSDDTAANEASSCDISQCWRRLSCL